MGRKKKITSEEASEIMETSVVNFMEKTEKETTESISAAIEVIENVDFTSGKNKLSIRLTKRNDNRAYRMQVFLNDDFEIRPSTYNGCSTAKTFWSLLKGSLKND